MSLTNRNANASTDAGLTSSGIHKAVSRHCEIDAPLANVQGRRKRELMNIVEYLVAHDKADRSNLFELFIPDTVSAPAQGRYTETEAQAWFSDMVAPNLRRLPFIDETDGTWSFTGVDAGDYGDDETRPLADLRGDPETQLETALDELGVARQSDEREQLRTLHKALRKNGELSADELERSARRASLPELEPLLLELPGIERDEHSPRDPADIEIETYADVLDAEAVLEEPPTVMLRYSG